MNALAIERGKETSTISGMSLHDVIKKVQVLTFTFYVEWDHRHLMSSDPYTCLR